MPLGPRLIVEKLVKLFPRLHARDKVFLASLLFEVNKELVYCFHCDSECGDWINNAIVTELFKIFDVNVGSLAKLSHVCQQEHFRVVLL